ncbi:MAG: hypothetical protein U9P80_08040, partial [Thermodesulfobacteriota bacterium]|nr:hypothetical protein [Thermodesulfobacteriota bacterium]
AHTDTKAVVIAGTRHVLKDLKWQATPEPSLADRLQYRNPFSIVMWPDFLMHGHAIGLDISGMSPKTCPYPPMQAMNLMPFSSLTASADGVILLPEQEI